MTAPAWYTGPHAGVNNRRRSGKPRAKPRAIEHKIQVALMDFLAVAARPEIYYFAIPNQSNRHINNAVKMKAEGVRSGVADICIMLPGGKSCWLEMKAPGGSLSPDQKVFRLRCEQLDHGWAMARSVDEAIPHLKAWGAIR